MEIEMEIEMAIEARDKEERQKSQLSPRDGYAATAGDEDDYLHEEPMTSEGVEFDDYLLLDHLEDDEDSEAMESPYSRKNATASRQSMNRPSSSSSHRRTGTGKDDANKRTYHDAHGSAGWRAELMAPSPVRNPSAKYLHEQSKRKKESAKVLYLHALDEAVLMQQRFLTCVNEANIFSAALNKGTVYRVMERDPTEDQHWKTILDPKVQPVGGVVRIPKGTGQRIAKMLVEVSNPDRDVRYLSTGHFFREHGRLQDELQRKCAVDGTPADMLIESVRSEFETGSTESPVFSSPRSRRPKSASYLLSASKDSISFQQRSGISKMPSSTSIGSTPADSTANVQAMRRSLPNAKTLPTVTESAALKTSSPPNTYSSPEKADKSQQQGKKSVSYQEYRREIETQLKKILSAIVTRAHEIQAQTEFIKASGWNWLEPTDYLPGT